MPGMVYARLFNLKNLIADLKPRNIWQTYLKQINRPRESLKIFESLLSSTHLTEIDKVRVREEYRRIEG